MHRTLSLAAVAFGVVVALAPGAAAAQASDRWQFGASLYGWFPSLSGKTTFPPQVASTDVSVDAGDILSNLEFVFMGSFQARKGRWGAFTDLIYLDLGGSKSGTREFSLGGAGVPAGVTGNVDYDVEGWVWTLAGEYRAMEGADASVDVFAGARYLDVEQTLDYRLEGDVDGIPVVDRSGRRRVDAGNWDAIVGAKGRIAFGPERRWFAPWYLDVGTGESDLTWQAMGGLGYAFSWGEVVAAWRYLDYRIGTEIDRITFSGPAVAVNFRW